MSHVVCMPDDAVGGPQVGLLEAAGFTVEQAPPGSSAAPVDDLAGLLAGAAAVIASAEPYSRGLLARLPGLRVISRRGVGFDAVDLAACDAAGVVVTTTPGCNHESVAEHAIAMLMALARGFPGLDARVRAGEWRRRARPRVTGSTLGIVGLGWIGKAVATRALGLGMQVLAVEPEPDRAFVERHRITLTTLDALLARSDFVSLHCPGGEATHHLVDAKRIERMKPGAVLINTARGSLVDETALVDALRAGAVRAAGLDVFETEPLPLDSPLLGVEGLLVSGHVAGLDEASREAALTLAARNIIDLHAGRWPEACVRNGLDPAAWRW